jgi:hypothetical protein
MRLSAIIDKATKTPEGKLIVLGLRDPPAFIKAAPRDAEKLKHKFGRFLMRKLAAALALTTNAEDEEAFKGLTDNQMAAELIAALKKHDNRTKKEKS